MGTFLVFIAGVLFLAAILFIKPRAQKAELWKTVLNWTLFVLWYGITWMGISYIYLNAKAGHVKATSTAVFVFLGISVVLGFILARLLGFINLKKTESRNAVEA